MFTPFGFVRGEAAAPGPRTDIPPYNPYVYFDATNTSYSSANYMNDVVSLGADPTHDFSQKTGNPTYTSGQYWEIYQPGTVENYYMSSSLSTSDFLRNLGSLEHTIIALHYPYQTSEADIIASDGLGGSAVLLMLYAGANNGVRGHAWNGSALASTDATSATPTNQWNFAAQRLSITGASTCRLDIFYDPVGSLPPTKIVGSDVGYSVGSNSGVPIVGARTTDGQKYDGRIAQLVIYDAALTDSEVNDVMDYMKTRSGL